MGPWSGDGGPDAATATTWSQPRTKAKRESGTDTTTGQGTTADSTTGQAAGARISSASPSTATQVFEGPAPLIAHIVLFRLRPEVSLEERRALIDAWAAALNDIPMIRRARVGQRVRVGRSYESLTRLDFPYAAVLEFDDVDGLRAYLDHPTHEAMATRLFAVIADTLIYDFEMSADVEGKDFSF